MATKHCANCTCKDLNKNVQDVYDILVKKLEKSGWGVDEFLPAEDGKSGCFVMAKDPGEDTWAAMTITLEVTADEKANIE